MLKLLSDADVFITSNRTPALKRMGLDYETLHKKFPRLVWAQLRGYGERGKWPMSRDTMPLPILRAAV